MRTLLTPNTNIVLISDSNQVLGFTIEKFEDWTHLGEKVSSITNADNLLLKCDCIDSTILGGIRGSGLFLLV